MRIMKTASYVTTTRRFGIEVFDRGTHFEAQVTNRRTGQLCGQSFGASLAEVESRISDFYFTGAGA